PAAGIRIHHLFRPPFHRVLVPGLRHDARIRQPGAGRVGRRLSLPPAELPRRCGARRWLGDLGSRAPRWSDTAQPAQRQSRSGRQRAASDRGLGGALLPGASSAVISPPPRRRARPIALLLLLGLTLDWTRPADRQLSAY